MDDSLSFESFLKGARTAAQKAMDDHARGEYDEFALHGGVAFERLAKAVLVSKNPAYLVEMRNGNSDMLLYLCGDLKKPPKNVRTVGAMEAVGRLRSMGLLSQDEQLDDLIALRNGTAHTTIGDQAKTLLPALAENVEALLKHLNQPTGVFWGRWASAIGAAVDKERDEIQRDVEIRIKQAKHLFEDRFKGLPDDVKERALEARPGLPRSITILDSTKLLALISTMSCPACGALAQVKMRPEVDESAEKALRLGELTCQICGLELIGQDEIQAAGISSLAVPPPRISWSAEAQAAAEAERRGHGG
ncbi:hypothetical protein AB0N12_14440 [Streptomyces albogriseolus]|uniref:hypothetical protein n=1 Tax=Streptomyces albogriseolus TaxID=1887 RepID=UPI0034617684